MRVSMVYLCLLLIRTQTKASKVRYLANYAATYGQIFHIKINIIGLAQVLWAPNHPC